MEERHKIIIPTGADPDAALSQPFFNTEATRAARPVVPLPETDAPHNQAASTSAPRARRWAILAPLITAAVGIGVAAGLAISSYQRRQQPQQAETSVAVRPVAVKAPTTLPWTHTPEEILADEEMLASAPETGEAQGQTPEQTPVETRVREEADRDKERREARDEKRAEKQEDRHDRRQDEDDRANEARDDDRDRRRQGREQRRGRRNSQRDDDEDLPQDPIRRTRDEVHRIREIFEGIP